MPQQPPRMVRCGKSDRRSTCSRAKATGSAGSAKRAPRQQVLHLLSPPVSCSSPPWAVAEATDLPMRDVWRRVLDRDLPLPPRQCRGGDPVRPSVSRRAWRARRAAPGPLIPGTGGARRECGWTLSIRSVGYPPGHCFGVHPEHLRDLVRGAQPFGVLIGHVAHLSPGRLVHNGHVRPYCTYNLPHSKSHLRSDNHLRTPVRISARRCVELRAAARSRLRRLVGRTVDGFPRRSVRHRRPGFGVARRLLIPSVVIVRCRPRNPVTAHPWWASYRAGANAMTTPSFGGGR